MKAYVMGNYRINNLEMYMMYTKAVGSTVAQFGGKTLVVDHEPMILEGEPHHFTVVVEFPSKQTAREWYRSPNYQSIIDMRKNAVTGWVQIVAEFIPPRRNAVEVTNDQ